MIDFQPIATFTYPSDLAIAKSLLESMNIECYVKDELTVQVHNFYSNAIGGITLEIPKEKYISAKKLLVQSGYKNDLIELDNDFVEINEEDVRNFNLLKVLKFSIRFILIIATILILIVLVLVLFYDK